jgi:hypothetical protein
VDVECDFAVLDYHLDHGPGEAIYTVSISQNLRWGAYSVLDGPNTVVGVVSESDMSGRSLVKEGSWWMVQEKVK